MHSSRHFSVRHRQADEENETASRSRKEIVFIRHAQSRAQLTHHRERRKDESLRDADLSHEGVSQAYHLSKVFRKAKDAGRLGHELVLSSPLTRALKTALVALEGEQIVVHPGFAELNEHRPIPENHGRSVDELLCDSELLKLGIAERAHLEHVEELSWPSPSRVDGMEYLRSRSETKVVIFSHHNYIQQHLGHSVIVHNCEPIHAVVEFSSDRRHPTFELAREPHAWFTSGSE